MFSISQLACGFELRGVVTSSGAFPSVYLSFQIIRDCPIALVSTQQSGCVDNEHTETDSFRREAKSPFDTAEDELSEVEYVMIHAILKKEKLNQEGEC